MKSKQTFKRNKFDIFNNQLPLELVLNGPQHLITLLSTDPDKKPSPLSKTSH